MIICSSLLLYIHRRKELQNRPISAQDQERDGLIAAIEEEQKEDLDGSRQRELSVENPNEQEQNDQEQPDLEAETAFLLKIINTIFEANTNQNVLKVGK